MHEPAVLVMLREHLDHEIGIGATVLFDALAAWGPRVPATFAEVVDLVQGPLRAALIARFGEVRAAEVVRRLEQALRFAELPTRELAVVPRMAFDDRTTKRIPPPAEVPRLLCIGASGRLGERIGALIDRSASGVISARSLDDVERAARPIELALIDGADPITADPDVLARTLLDLPLVLVWAREASGAEATLRALERANVPAMGFARHEPVDPMIDVLRSRFG